ncbi:MAG: type II toxin-antitoxin system ParD family antitoxin [Pseudomonadota bacterium]
MSRNPSVSLTPRQQAFVADLVASGRYHGLSEVVRAGLRLLEDQEAERVAYLRRVEAAIDEGIASGPPEPLDVEALLAEAKRG